MIIGHKEKMNNFLQRIEKKVNELAFYKVCPAPIEQAKALLEGLKSPYLTTPSLSLMHGESAFED